MSGINNIFFAIIFVNCLLKYKSEVIKSQLPICIVLFFFLLTNGNHNSHKHAASLCLSLSEVRKPKPKEVRKQPPPPLPLLLLSHDGSGNYADFVVPTQDDGARID